MASFEAALQLCIYEHLCLLVNLSLGSGFPTVKATHIYRSHTKGDKPKKTVRCINDNQLSVNGNNNPYTAEGFYLFIALNVLKPCKGVGLLSVSVEKDFS